MSQCPQWRVLSMWGLMWSPSTHCCDLVEFHKQINAPVEIQSHNNNYVKLTKVFLIRISVSIHWERKNHHSLGWKYLYHFLSTYDIDRSPGRTYEAITFHFKTSGQYKPNPQPLHTHPSEQLEWKQQNSSKCWWGCGTTGTHTLLRV